MYNVGLVDGSLGLIEALNTDVIMSVNTPHGETEKVVLPTLVAQGDLMAPLEASV